MRTICKRLRRGDDLLLSIRRIAEEENLRAAVVLSAVGCVSCARLRDASGRNIRELPEHFEIVSMTGTVSAVRCHLHVALSGEDLSTVGGHLVPGCIVNTTCELVLLEMEDAEYRVEQDPETGYDEIVFADRTQTR